jgi:hypothetical protein
MMFGCKRSDFAAFGNVRSAAGMSAWVVARKRPRKQVFLNAYDAGACAFIADPGR